MHVVRIRFRWPRIRHSFVAQRALASSGRERSFGERGAAHSILELLGTGEHLDQRARFVNSTPVDSGASVANISDQDRDADGKRDNSTSELQKDNGSHANLLGAISFTEESHRIPLY